MSFGPQRNMVRRSHRADESFHREQRRKGLDRAAMLEAGTRRPRQPLLARMVNGLADLLRRGRK
ncbi:MAG TPA: hypothetical protein VFC78_08900 [Tepidisphaeraceae bacterium]|nr:hypothetical protein [Tepidisphaeraceae bacterium]